MATEEHAVIEKIEVLIVKAPLGSARFWSSQASFPERNSLLVKITAGDLVGWGEGGQYGPAEPVAVIIECVFGQRLLGRRVQPRVIHDLLYTSCRDFGPRGPYIDAISAIDVALWDLLGKQTGKPICELLGGASRDRVKVYATGLYYRHDHDDPSTIDVAASVDAAHEEALAYKAAGFRGVKMKVGLLSVEDDLARVKAVREALGPDIALMVDANHAYSVRTALRMAKALEEYDVRWFEEPVVPEDVEGYRRLRAATTVPIAGGECSFMRYGFKELLAGPDGPVLDIVQPDIGACGGITEFNTIASMASTFNTALVPHVWGSALSVAAALHGVAILPMTPFTANPVFLDSEPVMEFDRNPNPLRDELVAASHTFELDEDGALRVPMKPGLGVEVDEAVVAKYAVPLALTGVVERK